MSNVYGKVFTITVGEGFNEGSGLLEKVSVASFTNETEVRAVFATKGWVLYHFFFGGKGLRSAKTTRVVGRELRFAIFHLVSPSHVLGRNLRVRAVDRNLLEIRSETMELGVRIDKNAALQKSVGRKSDTGYDIRWGESSLLDLSMEITRNSIKFDSTDFN